jgi:hypothetical protein
MNDMNRVEIPDFERDAHRKVHLQVVNEMVEDTPVGNPELWAVYRESGGNLPPSLKGYVGGRARSNWQSSTLVPKAGEPNGPNQSSYSGASETKELNRQGIANLKPFSRSFVTNNTPYIVVLSDGLNGRQHSQQAPLMWMDTAMDRVEAQFDRGGK